MNITNVAITAFEGERRIKPVGKLPFVLFSTRVFCFLSSVSRISRILGTVVVVVSGFGSVVVVVSNFGGVLVVGGEAGPPPLPPLPAEPESWLGGLYVNVTVVWFVLLDVSLA